MLSPVHRLAVMISNNHAYRGEFNSVMEMHKRWMSELVNSYCYANISKRSWIGFSVIPALFVLNVMIAFTHTKNRLFKDEMIAIEALRNKTAFEILKIESKKNQWSNFAYPTASVHQVDRLLCTKIETDMYVHSKLGTKALYPSAISTVLWNLMLT